VDHGRHAASNSKIFSDCKFQKECILTIPKAAFSRTRLDNMRGVCLLDIFVQLVGAPVNTDVSVWTQSAGSPAMQRNKKGEMMLFRTAAISVLSLYRSGDTPMSDITPTWGVEVELYNADDRFCRTPFQDMVLDPQLDRSNVTEILIYMRGHANFAFPRLISMFKRPGIKTPILILE